MKITPREKSLPVACRLFSRGVIFTRARVSLALLSAKQRPHPYRSEPPLVYQALSTRHDWLVKKAIVDLPINTKRNSKRTSGNSLSTLGTQNQDLGAAKQRRFVSCCTQLQVSAMKILSRFRSIAPSNIFVSNVPDKFQH